MARRRRRLDILRPGRPCSPSAGAQWRSQNRDHAAAAPPRRACPPEVEGIVPSGDQWRLDNIHGRNGRNGVMLGSSDMVAASRPAMTRPAIPGASGEDE